MSNDLCISDTISLNHRGFLAAKRNLSLILSTLFSVQVVVPETILFHGIESASLNNLLDLDGKPFIPLSITFRLLVTVVSHGFHVLLGLTSVPFLSTLPTLQSHLGGVAWADTLQDV